MTNPNRKENLDQLIRAINHEVLFNPDPELRTQFQKLLELALQVETDFEALSQQASGLGIEWFNLRDKTTGHSLEDVYIHNLDDSQK